MNNKTKNAHKCYFKHLKYCRKQSQMYKKCEEKYFYFSIIIFASFITGHWHFLTCHKNVVMSILKNELQEKIFFQLLTVSYVVVN